jgi:hypothetical protein
MMLGRAAATGRARKLDQARISEDPDVIAHVAERRRELVGQFGRASRVILEPFEDLRAKGVRQRLG